MPTNHTTDRLPGADADHKTLTGRAGKKHTKFGPNKGEPQCWWESGAMGIVVVWVYNRSQLLVDEKQ